MKRVYIDLVEAAPEPIGWVCDECEGDVPPEDDGYALLVEADPESEGEGEVCMDCGTPPRCSCGAEMDVNCFGDLACPDCEPCVGCYSG